jgi:hypothetical protein
LELPHLVIDALGSEIAEAVFKLLIL